MRPLRGRERADGGFTLIELVVAIALAAFIFAALASVMVASLRAVGVQKSRTQGNDVATIGIEDLQRLKYNSLGLCAAPSGAAPTGLADTVVLPNCGGSPVKYGPCQAGGQPAGSVPSEQYVCVRRAITYTVRRYIAYGDVAHTEKRLAVVVDWNDEGGAHRVAQQSSLRIPSQNAVIGADPPQLDRSATSLTPGNLSLNPDGTNSTILSLSTQTTGLNSANGDSVIAVFETLGATGRQQQSLALTPNGLSSAWAGTLDIGAMRFGPGTQFVTFTATRVSDGKVNSLVYSSPLQVNGTVPNMPTVAFAQEPPANVALTPQGDLASPFTVAVTTTNISPDDSVALTIETQTGAVSLSMVPDGFVGNSCIVGQCQTVWRATVSPSAGYHFVAGTKYLYVTARQVPAGGYPVDAGATAADKTTPVAFG